MTARSARTGGTGVPAYIGYLLVILGIAVFLRVGFKEVRLALLGRSTDGVIVGVTKSRSVRSGPRLTVQFHESGRTSVFETLGMYPTPYATGDACRVRYLPGAEPTMAEIDSWPQLWRAMLVALTLALGLTGGGALIVRSARRRTNPPLRSLV